MKIIKENLINKKEILKIIKGKFEKHLNFENYKRKFKNKSLQEMYTTVLLYINTKTSIQRVYTDPGNFTCMFRNNHMLVVIFTNGFRNKRIGVWVFTLGFRNDHHFLIYLLNFYNLFEFSPGTK